MSGNSSGFVRQELASALPPPPRTTGVLGWIRLNLFSNAANSVMTVLALVFLALVLPPLADFVIFDAVWAASDRGPCQVEGAGACWAYIRDRLDFFVYGFYPGEEYWRINICFVIGAALLVPLLWPDLPYKSLTAILFFVVYPIVTFFLLNGGVFGLEEIPTEKWGGLTITLIISVVGIVTSLPIGIVLALGRRSKMPLVRYFCVGFIELWRAVPLITVLFMASIMLPLFLPEGTTIDKLLRALVGVSLFSAAYMAEVVRGGLQALPKGQYEAADALGLNFVKSMFFIILPQALKHVIPGIVNIFIALFKDTSLVSIVGIFDLLNAVHSQNGQIDWASHNQSTTGYLFAAAVFWVFCFGMSRYSIFIERRLDTEHKE